MDDLNRVTNEHGKLEAYAWPGGYDIAYYVQEGAMICAFCANDARDRGFDRFDDGTGNADWSVTAFDVTDSWDASEPCDHCGRELGPDNT